MTESQHHTSRTDERIALEDREQLTVGALSELVGVSVRTLHHYDEIALVRPSRRSSTGYRMYSTPDVERLQQVVVYRRLGFALEEIRDLLSGDGDVVEHLRRQKNAVMSQLDEMSNLVEAIDRALEAEMSGMQISKKEQKELFGDAFDDDYAVEAEQRWGDSDAWTQSRTRTESYGKGDWEQIKAEVDALNAAFAKAMVDGKPAVGEHAMDLAEQHRTHITTWFYDCSPGMHRGIGEMLSADPRFAASYEAVAPGLASYVSAAVVANADRQL